MYFIFNFKLLSIFKDFKNKNYLSIVNFYVPFFIPKVFHPLMSHIYYKRISE